jgi:hypothetical protein
MAACAGRGELGRLLFKGRGGGSIWVDVLREADREGGCGALVGSPDACGLETPCGERGTELMSGIVSLKSSSATVAGAEGGGGRRACPRLWSTATHWNSRGDNEILLD